MLKQLLSVAVLSTLSLSAFAQGESVNTSRVSPRMNESKFNEFVMQGFSVGLEYASMGGEGVVKLKNSTYLTGSYSVKTDKDAPGMGISGSYASVPRGGAGYIAGVTFAKTTGSDTKGQLGGGGEVRFLRPEINVAYALNNGLYGAVGGHLSHVSGADAQDAINQVGIGFQLQAGFVPMQNLGIDIGYYVSNHRYKEMTVSGTTLDGENSYINIKQLRARVSYLF